MDVTKGHDDNPRSIAFYDMVTDVIKVDDVLLMGVGVGLHCRQIFAVVENDNSKGQRGHDSRKSQTDVTTADNVYGVLEPNGSRIDPGLVLPGERVRTRLTGFECQTLGGQAKSSGTVVFDRLNDQSEWFQINLR